MPENNTVTRIAATVGAQARALPAGSRLPSVRELMASHRASPATVQRAIAQLTADGLVEPRPGRGTFVAARARATAGAARADLSWQEVALDGPALDTGGLDELLALAHPDAIVLSSGYPEAALQPAVALAAALTRAARRPGSWGRLPVEGLPELRTWFARAAGGALQGHDVVVCSGGQSALGTTFRALGAPGAVVLVESPTYGGALAAARAAGLRPVPVPADADGVRPELLADALKRTGARLVYCQPTFANPHGATLAPDRRAAVMQAVTDAGAFLVEDDWARDLGFDGPAPPPLVADDPDGHVVHLRSLTKSAAPGLRIAAVAGRGAAGSRLRAARVVDDFFVAGPLQHAALDLVSSPAWRTHGRRLRAGLAERRDALVAALALELPDLALAGVPRGGLHLWVRLPDGSDDEDLTQRAAAAGVVVSAGSRWYPGEPPAPHLRLTYAAEPPERLVEGVARLATVLR
jgi:DNA-binding transcriptional MocR family regulator